MLNATGHHRAVSAAWSSPPDEDLAREVTCSVLLVEDDEGHADLVQRALTRSHFCAEVKWVTSLTAAVASLADHHYDVVLCDLTLPDSRGAQTVSTIRQASPDTPLVVLTSLASEQMVSTALAKGAQDYLLKDVLVTETCGATVVERAIRHAIYRQGIAVDLQRLYRQARRHQKTLQEKNVRLAQLYNVAQTVVENVSHEFRTPLTVIKEYVALLSDGIIGEVSAEQGHFLDVVSDRAEDLNRMVDDMLDVSKIDAGLLTVRRGECDIAEIVRHVTMPLQRKAALKRVNFIVDLERDLPPVYCDADKAGRTMINLVVNSIKFCQDQGTVSLAVRFDEVSQEVIVTVTDDGPGIDEQDLQRIFTRFTQVDVTLNNGAKGFGLGLSIAKEMVEMNLGSIMVTSRLGAGSCFSFTLPRLNAVEISQRFLARLAQHKTASTVLLCTVHAAPAEPEELNAIEPLLYYVLRANDLVLRLSSDNWLVLLSCGQKSFKRFRERLAKVLQDTNRNRVRPELPQLTASLAGKWDVKRDRDAILADVHRFVREQEAKYALPTCADQ